MKKIFLILIICILLITGCSSNSNEYKVSLKKEPYDVCGKKTYFSNIAYMNELDMETIIDTVEEQCEISKEKDNLEELKNELENIIDDGDLTKSDIINHLEYVVDEYFD